MMFGCLIHKWKVPWLRIPLLEDSGTYRDCGELNSGKGKFFRWSIGDKEGREERKGQLFLRPGASVRSREVLHCDTVF